MKELIKLVKQRCKLYQLMLMGTVLFTLYISYLNINVFEFNSFDVMMKEGVTQEELAQYLERDASLFRSGFGGGEFLNDCFFDTIPEFEVICLIMAVLLIIVFWGENGSKQSEFIEMLPVKRVTKEMGKLLPLLGILLINCTVGIGSTLIQLTFKNKEILELEKQFPILLEGKISKSLIADANVAFLKEAGTVVLLLVGIFLLYYLFSMIFKNRSIGVVIGVVAEAFGESYIWMLSEVTGILRLEPVRRMVYSITEANPFYAYRWMAEPVNLKNALVSMVLIILIFACIIILSKKKNLSNGKFCYSRWMELFAVINVGILSASLSFSLGEMFMSPYIIEDYGVSMWILRFVSLALGTLVSVFVWKGIYNKTSHITKVEVKSRTRGKYPGFRLGLGGYFVILTILIIFSLVAQCETYMLIRYQLQDYVQYRDEAIIECILFEFDILKNVSNFEEHAQILVVILVFVVAYKCLEMYMTGNKTALFFTEVLPIKRKERFFTDFIKKIMLGLIPFSITILCVLLHVFGTSQVIGSVVWGAIPGVLAWYGVGVCYMVGVLGCIYLIDAVVVNPNMKIFCLFCLASFIGILSVFAEMTLGKFDFSYEVHNVIYALVFLAVGITMMILSYFLNERRDYSSGKFYFKFAAYGFALMVSIMFAFLVFVSFDSMKLYVFIPVLIVGTTALFLVTANWCIPEFKAFFDSIGKR